MFADPETAAVTLTADCPVRMCGLDLTHQVTANAAYATRLRATHVERRVAAGSPITDEPSTRWVHAVDGPAALDLIVAACARWA